MRASRQKPLLYNVARWIAKRENCTVRADKTVKRTVGTGKYIFYNHLGEVAGYLDGDTDDKKNTGILEKYIIHYSARGGWYCRLDAPVQEYTFLAK